LTTAELSRLDARGAFPEWPEASGVPRLSEVLDAFAGTVHFAIEIKSDTPERLELVCAALVGAIHYYRLPPRVTVTSFDPIALEIMRRRAPAISRAYIGAYDTPAFLETALRLDCTQADIPHARGSADVVREAQARGLRVVGWLGNTVEELQILLDWGVDGITTDYPSRALPFLRQRGIATDSWS
ncbi:MAG TPA: glycerophosphodiester phosphodiesterase, partial [Chloroflexota bacterium]|nr:glycerophosphodiester phosphodiesterase [Chloroflexota bacterium]